MNQKCPLNKNKMFFFIFKIRQKPVIFVLPLLIHSMFMYGEDEKKIILSIIRVKMAGRGNDYDH